MEPARPMRAARCRACAARSVRRASMQSELDREDPGDLRDDCDRHVVSGSGRHARVHELPNLTAPAATMARADEEVEPLLIPHDGDPTRSRSCVLADPRHGTRLSTTAEHRAGVRDLRMLLRGSGAREAPEGKERGKKGNANDHGALTFGSQSPLARRTRDGRLFYFSSEDEVPASDRPLSRSLSTQRAELLFQPGSPCETPPQETPTSSHHPCTSRSGA